LENLDLCNRRAEEIAARRPARLIGACSTPTCRNLMTGSITGTGEVPRPLSGTCGGRTISSDPILTRWSERCQNRARPRRRNISRGRREPIFGRIRGRTRIPPCSPWIIPCRTPITLSIVFCEGRGVRITTLWRLSPTMTSSISHSERSREPEDTGSDRLSRVRSEEQQHRCARGIHRRAVGQALNQRGEPLVRGALTRREVSNGF
jgi:hypothetical protein